jgi:hypothetical protein
MQHEGAYRGCEDSASPYLTDEIIVLGDPVPQRLIDYAAHQWLRPSVEQWLHKKRPPLDAPEVRMNDRILVLYGSYRSERKGIRLADFVIASLRARGESPELIDAKIVGLPGKQEWAAKRANYLDFQRLTLRASCPAKELATLLPSSVPRSIWVLVHTPSFKMYWNSSGR